MELWRLITLLENGETELNITEEQDEFIDTAYFGSARELPDGLKQRKIETIYPYEVNALQIHLEG